MKLEKLLRGLSYEKAFNFDKDTEISKVCFDSRKVEAGDLFVCIEGFKSDGHKFIGQAKEAGAAFFICAHEIEDETLPYIVCENTRHALSVIAANYYDNPSDKFKVIGVTGTNGKTSTTYMLKAILERAGFKVGLIGTNQNMIGQKVIPTDHTTPESLDLQALFADMAKEQADYVVMEVSSHSLALNRVDSVKFAVGIFTNLTQDHLDFHKDMDDYFSAKAKLFSQCETAVINRDDDRFYELKALIKTPMLSYSIEHNDADSVAKNLRQKSTGVDYELLSGNTLGRVSLKIPGRFSVYNSLAAITAAVSLGIDVNLIREAMTNFTGVVGRAELVHIDADFSVIIDYAHTPDGLENIINTILEYKKGRLITLFGCGGDRDPDKRPKMGRIAASLSDYCVITSDNPRTEDPSKIIKDIVKGIKRPACPYKVIENRREAIRYALSIAEKDDVVLLAGKGHEPYQILSTGTIHFDEREVVAEEFAKLKALE
ncbi:MAG: UDP-N-acetylmuramoyl-L-alanyl-D-glutamate--2,6-diaminopimelate ligase [Clostridia bacterium]|nr:UDP-N-acetylmuramoyl-L-alanyl-D-glutamate--2,6-diaminopimelate ligase [Clostridia bacterium]MBQ1375111.1 UDP-N-acetylmuramoyl-L-alanyl-D-glutamate--2,6-diaminopimelate ligase [Clostridia bacterium]MBQ1435384.1 UDP-N-acetylmuramoyl-L-alanyl-D-glutamate--2,6-diaminopimelate ligase [Clostridia bacterium]